MGFTPTVEHENAKRAEMAEEIRLSAAADGEAAERYRTLADRNPGLKRDYLRRADLCDLIQRAKLAVLDDMKRAAKFADAVRQEEGPR